MILIDLKMHFADIIFKLFDLVNRFGKMNFDIGLIYYLLLYKKV